MTKTVHVVIKEPSFEGYTGIMYGAEFVDGKSVQPLNEMDAVRLGAIMAVETVDGEDLNPISREMVARGCIDADQAKTLEVSAQPTAKTQKAKAKIEAVLAPSYTREELEAIADSQGIRGLRDLANGLGVKGRSIEEIIGEILELQGGK